MNAPHGVLNSLEAASGSLLTDDGYKLCSRGAIKRLHSITSIFHLLRKNFNWSHMKHEMEKNRGDAAPHPMDDGSTANGGEFERFEGFESSKGCQSEQEGGSDQREQPFRTVQNPSEPTSDLEERVRADCRRSCRRNFWIAALGLSSFNEED